MRLDAVIKEVKAGKERRSRGRAMALSNIQSSLDAEEPAVRGKRNQEIVASLKPRDGSVSRRTE